MHGLIDILIISHNRPDYTSLSLQRLLESCNEQMRVWLWQNGSHPATVEVVRRFATHPRVYRYYESPTNLKLRGPMNWIFREADGQYIAKIDDDCLVPDGWHLPLVALLSADPTFGVAACWHFHEADFDASLAAPKIREYTDGIRAMLNPWVQGSGFIMKRECVDQCGLLPDNVGSFTPYCWMLFNRGWHLGWPLPLVLIDHMDDPRSLHSRFQSEEDFLRDPPLSAEFGGVRSLAEWRERIQWNARQVLEAPLDPRAYRGWRHLKRRIERRVKGALGLWPPWRIAARK